jgi:hypothetical protein
MNPIHGAMDLYGRLPTAWRHASQGADRRGTRALALGTQLCQARSHHRRKSTHERVELRSEAGSAGRSLMPKDQGSPRPPALPIRGRLRLGQASPDANPSSVRGPRGRPSPAPSENENRGPLSPDSLSSKKVLGDDFKLFFVDKTTLSLEPPLRAPPGKIGQQKRIPADRQSARQPRHVFGAYTWCRDSMTWTMADT